MLTQPFSSSDCRSCPLEHSAREQMPRRQADFGKQSYLAFQSETCLGEGSSPQQWLFCTLSDVDCFGNPLMPSIQLRFGWSMCRGCLEPLGSPISRLPVSHDLWESNTPKGLSDLLMILPFSHILYKEDNAQNFYKPYSDDKALLKFFQILLAKIWAVELSRRFFIIWSDLR